LSLLDASLDLFADVDINQSNANAELAAEFIVRQTDTEDLFADFIVRHSDTKELYAKFEAQVTRNLFADLTVRHSASEDLLADFTVRHSDTKDLKFTFLISRDDWTPQGITYEEYLLRVRSTIIV